MNLQTLCSVEDSLFRPILMLETMNSMRVLRDRSSLKARGCLRSPRRNRPFDWQERTWKSQLLLLERNGATVKEGGRLLWRIFDPPKVSWEEIDRWTADNDDFS